MVEYSWKNIELAPIILLKGNETVFSTRAYKRIKNLALTQNPNTEIIEIDPKTYNKGQLYIHTTPSLFGEEKLIRIQNLETANEDLYTDLIEYTQNPQSDIYFVLHHETGIRGKKLLDTLKKQKTPTVTCETIKNPKDKIALIQNDLHSEGKKITLQAAKRLVDAFANDLENLVAAVNQLAYDINGEITIQDVEKYYSGRLEINAYNIADEVITGNTDKSLILLRHALTNGVAPVQIVAAITTKLRSLIKVKGMKIKRLRPVDIGMAPWQAEKLTGLANRWSEQSLANAITYCVEADYEVKGGSKSQTYSLEKMVIKITKELNK